MPSRLPKLLFDALTALRLAREFASGLSHDQYSRSLLVRSAVERQLEILGEACQRMLQVDPDIRQRIPEIGLAVGLRNRIIHGYDKVEAAIVYETLQRDLPAFASSLQAELDRLAPA